MLLLFQLAARGAPLHHGFANRAAKVEGELADVIGNMPLVRTFGAIHREHSRFDRTVGRELTARRRSLQYLERLRLLHAVLTIVLTVAVLAWAIVLWQRGQASAGDVVLVCTLGFTVLHATRDLAVALVDVTQHMARLAEAIATLLQAHELREHPKAVPLARRREGTSQRRSRTSPSAIPAAARCSRTSGSTSRPAGAPAWSAPRAAASRRRWRCCSASTTSSAGAS